MKVGLESVVSYFPEKVMKRSDFAYLDGAIPEGQEAMFKGPHEIRRLDDENGVEILAENVTRKVLFFHTQTGPLEKCMIISVWIACL